MDIDGEGLCVAGCGLYAEEASLSRLDSGFKIDRGGSFKGGGEGDRGPVGPLDGQRI